MFAPRSIAPSLKASKGSIARAYAVARPLTDPIDVENVRRRQAPHVTKVSKLDSGIRVVTVDTGKAVSRLSVYVHAGSRFEASSEKGLTHVVKNSAFRTNANRTGFRIAREMQQFGGGLECASTREFIIRKATFMRNYLPEVLESVVPDVICPQFHSWDLDEARSAARAENAAVAADICAGNLELAHKAAYRSGLGNSLYCDDLSLDGISQSQLLAYTQHHHVGEKITIAAADVDHDELVRYARDLFSGLPRGKPHAGSAQKYHGGEYHIKTGTKLAHVSLLAEGVSWTSQDLAAFAVMQRILGTSSALKWGSNTASRLNKAAVKVTDGPLLIHALNFNYSDSGLFGIYAIASSNAILPVMKAAVAQVVSLGKGDVSTEELERAKNQVRSSVMIAHENKDDCVEDLAKQVALAGSYVPVDSAVAKIDSVTKEHIVKIGQKLLTGPATLVATGETASSPYIDELFP